MLHTCYVANLILFSKVGHVGSYFSYFYGSTIRRQQSMSYYSITPSNSYVVLSDSKLDGVTESGHLDYNISCLVFFHEQKCTFVCLLCVWCGFRSHDGFTEDDQGVLLPKPGSKYASQQIVFDNLGKGVLNNAFDGECSRY